jgi:hypothetical protein
MMEELIIRLQAGAVPLFGLVAFGFLFTALRARFEHADPYTLTGLALPGVLALAAMLHFGNGLVRRVAEMDGHDAMWLTVSAIPLLTLAVPIAIALVTIIVYWHSRILLGLGTALVVINAAWPAPMMMLARQVYALLTWLRGGSPL